MEPEPTVTFVIPTHNRKGYLREALVSLQNQTVSAWKCVVVDDYSDEDIQGTVAELQDERIRCIPNTHAPGVSGARNTGNQAVDTEWIALADSDDINLPRRLEVSLAAIEKHPGDDVFYSTIYAFKDGTYEFKMWKYGESYERTKLYDHNFIANNTALYRKQTVLDLGGYDEQLASAEDYDMWLKFSDRHLRFHYIKEPLALYRRHGNQFTAIDGGREAMRATARQVRENHAKFL